MKADKVASNLYMLKGDTFQHTEAAVVTTKAEESTILWHRKLGHMSERGLKILAEKGLLCGLTKVTLPFVSIVLQVSSTD